MKKARQPTTPLTDERNVARLGIVSIQTRLDDEASRSWSTAFEIAGRSFSVSAEAPHGRPRGTDTNVMIGIESLFSAQGCPEDNRLHTTAYQLRAASFLPLNGKSFHRLRESLDRLWYTSVTATDGWHLPDGRRLRNVTRMRLINDLSYWDIDNSDGIRPGRELVPTATLTIQLGTQLANSIRSGFTQILEHKILTRIEQPPARALYRLLEAHRYADMGEQLPDLHVGLEDWRLACGITDGKPSKTLRALGEAHEELAAQGYLRDVRVSGSRANVALTYQFATLDDPDPALVRLLVESGVAAPAANKLAKDKGDRIETVVRHVQQMMREQPESIRKPGPLIDGMLQNPDKYVLDSQDLAAPNERREDSQVWGRAAEAGDEQRTERERNEVNGAPPAPLSVPSAHCPPNGFLSLSQRGVIPHPVPPPSDTAKCYLTRNGGTAECQECTAGAAPRAVVPGRTETAEHRRSGCPPHSIPPVIPVVNTVHVPHYSPFRYPGGKSWFIPRLRRWLTSRERPAVFVEPFAGGGSSSCTVALEGLADHVVMVELDHRVAAVWEVIFGGQAEVLAQRILNFDMSVERTAAILATDPTNPMDVAWRTIIQNRVSRGGIIARNSGVLKRGERGKGMFSRWYPDTLAQRIRALNAVRDRVTVICGDALPVMERYAQRQDVSVFVDPPYTAGGKGAGRRLYTHNVVDHPRLFRLAAELHDVVMTYDDAPEVRALAQQNGLQITRMAMRNAHHAVMEELLIGRTLTWKT